MNIIEHVLDLAAKDLAQQLHFVNDICIAEGVYPIVFPDFSATNLYVKCEDFLVFCGTRCSSMLITDNRSINVINQFRLNWTTMTRDILENHVKTVVRNRCQVDIEGYWDLI